MRKNRKELEQNYLQLFSSKSFNSKTGVMGIDSTFSKTGNVCLFSDDTEAILKVKLRV